MTPRDRVLSEAQDWIHTPYHHQAHIKGVGVDCVWLLLEVYRTAGVIPYGFDPGNYSREWYLHRSEEIYMGGIERYATRLVNGTQPEPGDVALYKIGRCVSHGSIIVDDDYMIHANRLAREVEITERRGPLSAHFHSYWTPFL